MSDKPKRSAGRPPKNPGLPKGTRSKKLISVRLDPELAERLDQFIVLFEKVHMLQTERSAHIEKSIARYLNEEEPKLKPK